MWCIGAGETRVGGAAHLSLARANDHDCELFHKRYPSVAAYYSCAHRQPWVGWIRRGGGGGGGGAGRGGVANAARWGVGEVWHASPCKHQLIRAQQACRTPPAACQHVCCKLYVARGMSQFRWCVSYSCMMHVACHAVCCMLHVILYEACCTLLDGVPPHERRNRETRRAFEERTERPREA